MDAETLVPLETLEQMYQPAETEIWVKLTEEDARELARSPMTLSVAY